MSPTLIPGFYMFSASMTSLVLRRNSSHFGPETKVTLYVAVLTQVWWANGNQLANFCSLSLVFWPKIETITTKIFYVYRGNVGNNSATFSEDTDSNPRYKPDCINWRFIVLLSPSRQHPHCICVVLRYNATQNGSFVPTFRDNVSVPCSRVRQSLNTWRRDRQFVPDFGDKAQFYAA